MAGFFVAGAEAQKSRVITPGPCADEPVYRVTGDGQESSNTHPSIGGGQPSRNPSTEGCGMGPSPVTVVMPLETDERPREQLVPS